MRAWTCASFTEWGHSIVRPWLRHRHAKWVVWLACAVPLAWWVWGAWQDLLGANPAQYLTRSSGEQALRMLCVTLCITPLRVLTAWPEWVRFRRLLGLWMYAYAVLHALCYAWFDMGLELIDIVRDVAKRPFILVGVVSLCLLTPLAATSWHGAVRRLGAARWQALHRTVYVVAPLAVLHFYWMRASKHHFEEVWGYGLGLAALLLWRVYQFTKRS